MTGFFKCFSTVLFLGPLVVHGMLIGIVSWGKGCASAHHPGVYVYIPAFRGFIHQVTGI